MASPLRHRKLWEASDDPNIAEQAPVDELLALAVVIMVGFGAGGLCDA